jgi:predicted MFS family arabinose efflux permease
VNERRRELEIALLIAAVQFINILEFMMIAPLGPDLAKALKFDVSKMGLVTGSYTGAAVLSGIAGAFFLERFDRRSALAVAMSGLVCGTFTGGLATGMGSLMAARILAGSFGGPATAISFSIIADMIPVERRGKAMGIVLSAFSISSIAGVPIGLELARRGGWQVPFFAVAGLGLIVTGIVIVLLPPLRKHLELRSEASFRGLLRPTVYLSYAMTFTVMLAGFILIPNLSAYTQGNLHFPRKDLSYLYLAGGLLSIVTINVVGRIVDRVGSFVVGTFATIAFAILLEIGFIHYLPIPTVLLFMTFMFSMNVRNVAYNTLTTKVPSAAERARFMSGQSAVQSLASTAGALLSAAILTKGPNESLVHVDVLAWISLGLTITLPFFLHAVERRIQ